VYHLRAAAVTCLVIALALALASRDARAQSAPEPQIHTLVVAEADPMEDGDSVELRIVVIAEGPIPTGDATLTHYPSDECTGTPLSSTTGPLVAGVYSTSHEALLSNAAGWDSATTWISNNVHQFASNWHGSVFMGYDLAFFADQSSGWRFTGVPLRATDTVDEAHLSLRIRRTRPNISSETFGFWKTLVKVDRFDGSDFEGLDRTSFLQRFNSAGVPWAIDFQLEEPDPFGTGQGATYAAAPDISALIQQRIVHQSWQLGGDVAVGVINNGTQPIAEAAVLDEPDYARLFIRWTRHEDAGEVLMGPLILDEGPHSFRAAYSGDGAYAPAQGPCVTLTVLPRDTSRDGYSDNEKLALGKDPFDYCSIMRADVHHTGVVQFSDVLTLIAHLGLRIPDVPQRYDQGPPGEFDNVITFSDLMKVLSVLSGRVDDCP
jgi:hypothetical protein